MVLKRIIMLCIGIFLMLGISMGNVYAEESGQEESFLKNRVVLNWNPGYCAVVDENGDLYCWGHNQYYGAVGNGTTENQYTPVKVLEHVVKIVDSCHTVAAITEDGDLYCWGNNNFGQIGNGTQKHQLKPVKVLDNVKNVMLSGYTTVAIKENGDLYCWGDNRAGEVGNETTEAQLTPIKVLEGVKDVKIASYNIVALKETGELYGWGYHNYEQNEDNDLVNHQLTPIKLLENVKKISLSGGRSYSLRAGVITKNGDLYCWGENNYGQVGNGNCGEGLIQKKPVKVLENVKEYYISSEMQSMALTQTGEVYCWGYREGTAPVKKPIEDVKQIIGANRAHHAAITKNGDLYCWGRGREGQVGNGTKGGEMNENYISNPVKVLENVKTVKLPEYGSAAITENGELYCWGENCGQLGTGMIGELISVPTKVMENVKDVFPYYDSASILTINGELYRCGKNDYGTIGDGTTETQCIPVKILNNIMETGITDSNTSDSLPQRAFAVTTDGDLYIWGSNDDGSIGNGTNSTEVQTTPYKVITIGMPPDTNSNIVKAVEKYTTDAIYAQYDEIMNSDLPEEVKFQKYYELFRFNGFADVKEGVHYLSDTREKRYAYLKLTTDDMYCAKNYQYWLDHTGKGHAARALLLADGLVFNNEINDWMSFSTYAENDYPGVEKYKEMLYDFMDTSVDTIEVMDDIKMVHDIAKGTNKAAKQMAENLISKLNNCKTGEEADKLMRSAEAKKILTSLAIETDEDGNPVFSLTLNDSSGFGQFAKAMKYACKGVKLMHLSYEHTLDIMTMDKKLAVYAQYRGFLKDIVADTGYLPFQLRWAAQQILDELEEGYIAKFKDIAFDILDMSSLDDDAMEAILGKAKANSFSEWLLIIEVEAFFINKVADIGEMVKKEAYVEAYAYLSASYKRRLEEAKQNFLADKLEANAWDFYYNYNMLYRLRYEGEKAYLEYSKVKGLAALLTDFGYKEKKKVVDETLAMLQNECRFIFDENEEVSESEQYESKAVVERPVDIKIYNPDGQVIAHLKDGEESDESNEYGRFAVVYDAYQDGYKKIICLKDDQDYKIEMKAAEDGSVTMEMANRNREDEKYTMQSRELAEKDKVIASMNELLQENSYSIDIDGDGSDDAKETVSTQDVYVKAEALELSQDTLELEEGGSDRLRVNILPVSATNKSVRWFSSNPEVADVKNGRVTAHTAGSAKIYAVARENTDLMGVCQVKVEHIAVKDMSVAPTCTTAGKTEGSHCSVCHEILLKQEELPAEGHVWDKGSVTREATLGKEGERTYICLRCGDIYGMYSGIKHRRANNKPGRGLQGDSHRTSH